MLASDLIWLSVVLFRFLDCFRDFIDAVAQATLDTDFVSCIAQIPVRAKSSLFGSQLYGFPSVRQRFVIARCWS